MGRLIKTLEFVVALKLGSVSRMDFDNEQERLKFADLKLKAGFSDMVS